MLRVDCDAYATHLLEAKRRESRSTGEQSTQALDPMLRGLIGSGLLGPADSFSRGCTLEATLSHPPDAVTEGSSPAQAVLRCDAEAHVPYPKASTSAVKACIQVVLAMRVASEGPVVFVRHVSRPNVSAVLYGTAAGVIRLHCFRRGGLLWQLQVPRAYGRLSQATVVEGSEGAACVVGTSRGVLLAIDLRLGCICKAMRLSRPAQSVSGTGSIC